MSKRLNLGFCLASAASLALVSTTSAAEPVVRPLDTPVKEVLPERVLEGTTVEEYQLQHQLRSAWLGSILSAEALANPVVVEGAEATLQALNMGPVATNEPLRVGVVVPLAQPVVVSGVSIDRGTKNARNLGGGSVEVLHDGSATWSRAFTSVDAGGIRIHLRGVSLPEGTELYMFSQDGEAYGPYTGRGPNGDGDFWADSVASDTGVLVLVAPNAEDLKDSRLMVEEIGHITPSFYGRATEGNTASFCQFNASCIQNRNCTSSPAAADAEGAAAKMLWVAGCCINTCTGGLLADTDGSSNIPYFLTANHCISRSNHASTLEAFFSYDVSCGTNTCTATFTDPPNSLISGKTNGATLAATNKTGDFTLLILSQAPPSGSTFLGWSTTPVANTNGAELHRISHPSGAPQSYSQHDVDTSVGTCSSWPRGSWIYSRDMVGGIEGGSSGSPVVNSAGQVVGQLSGTCGFSPSSLCNSGPGDDNATVDGAFASYFSQVSSFLDPGTGCVPSTEVCNDGIDNDCDNAIDCNDSNCSGSPSCSCLPLGSSCTSNGQCCSNSCKGPPGGKTCK